MSWHETLSSIKTLVSVILNDFPPVESAITMSPADQNLLSLSMFYKQISIKEFTDLLEASVGKYQANMEFADGKWKWLIALRAIENWKWSAGAEEKFNEELDLDSWVKRIDRRVNQL
jgi:hypothetical protein